MSAVTTLLAKKQFGIISAALRNKELKQVLATIEVLANTRDGRVVGILMPMVTNPSLDLEVRRQSTRAVALTSNGAKRIITLAEQKRFPAELQVAAAFPLNNSPSGFVREKAVTLFPLPPARDNAKLPPISKLVQMRGKPDRGKKLYATTGTCAKCHIVRKEGKEVGPNLSEIGSKLSRQAMLESILYPSAGISHNYETYSVRLENGNVITGLLVSKTDKEVVLKTNDAIVRTYKQGDIEAMKKQSVSMMPSDLQKNLSAQDLVDIVEYMISLKKQSK